MSVVEDEVEKGEDKTKRSVSPKSRMKAVAEKVSAARELARKLAEEKEAAVKTGKQYRWVLISVDVLMIECLK